MDLRALDQQLSRPPLGTATHSVRTIPYGGIEIMSPGKYGLCDFLVRVTSPELGWNRKPFRHTELFEDIQQRYNQDPDAAQALLESYFRVVQGQDPNHLAAVSTPPGTLPSPLFLQAVQCLALAEERRYSDLSWRGGGRWLPWRFSYGIAHGRFTAAQASAVEKRGLPAICELEGITGIPANLAEHLNEVQLRRP